jgi:hypothetical protein
LHHNNALSLTFFTTEFFTENNMTVVLHPPYFSLLSQLKIKLKGCHFDTIKVTEAEFQAVLNILKEHEFRVTFKIPGALGTVPTRGSGLLRG